MNALALAVPAAPAERQSGPPDLAGDSLAALWADPRQAIQDDTIRCLICGRAFRQLTNTHLRGHKISAMEYKRRFGYNRGRPLMCRALQQLYAERAVKSGLAARIRCRPILVRPELRRRGGARTIALEELLTRRDARRGSRRGLVPSFPRVPAGMGSAGEVGGVGARASVALREPLGESLARAMMRVQLQGGTRRRTRGVFPVR